jgi:site-specific DNA-methyltransferase (adenine-specific)
VSEIIKNCTLHNIDCMEYMKSLPDNAFDLAIVDPPYGIDAAKTGKVGGNKLGIAKDYGAKNWDANAPDENYFIELKRISKNQIIWGANHFISNIKNASSPCWIVWDKQNTGNFADCELAYTSFETAVRKFSFMWNGMLQGDMKNKENRIHPTQNPVKLYEWLLTNYAKQGDKILDTHLGSGSHAIACNNLNFELVACELDKDYYEASIKRIKAKASQERLF